MTLHPDFLSMLDVRSCEELKAALVRRARQAGFELVTATCVVDMPDRTTRFLSINNTPEDYRNEFQSREGARRDPVMQYIKRSNLPIVWSRKTYVDAGQADLWECQAPHGFVTGVAVAMHLPGGKHFVFGYDRDQSLPSHPSEITRIVADMQLFAVYAQDAAFRVVLDEQPEGEPPTLTPRELECLTWTIEGKTAWELARILGISEHTAVRHIFNASRKLGCAGKLQAAIRALRLGLIR